MNRYFIDISVLSFHEICQLVRTANTEDINHILSQMVHYIHFEDYDHIDRLRHRKKHKRHMVVLGGAHRGY